MWAVSAPLHITLRLIAVAFVWVLWNKTRFGKTFLVIGGNPEAAKVSGVNVALNLLMIYALRRFMPSAAYWKQQAYYSATNNPLYV